VQPNRIAVLKSCLTTDSINDRLNWSRADMEHETRRTHRFQMVMFGMVCGSVPRAEPHLSNRHSFLADLGADEKTPLCCS